MATVLVPAWVAPARTITVPTTLARTEVLTTGPGGSVVFDFAPTHIAFSWRGEQGTGVEFRTVAPDGLVSPWTRATEAHDAERRDRHFSGVLAVERPASIQWRSITPRGKRMGAPKLDYLNTLDGPRGSREIPATAAAAATTPEVITRAQWGADESLKRTSGGCERRFFPLQQMFVHHTAGTNFDDHPKATMRAIYWYHVVRQGWCDIGYNFVIGPDGRIFEGRWARPYAPWEMHDSEDRRGRVVAAAHVSDFNSGSVGISVMGNYSQVAPPPAMRRSLAEILAWEADRHDLKPRGSHTYRNPESGLTRYLPYIAGHRDAGQTECPGNFLYGSLRAVRRDVAAVMGPGKSDSIVTLQASASRVVYGEQVTFSGVVTDANGLALADSPVRTYVREGPGDWVAGPAASTAPDGSFSFVVTPERNRRVVAIFDGDPTRWGSESIPVSVQVAPVVSIAADGGVPDGAGIQHYPAGTTTILFSGDMSPAHAGSTVIVRVDKLSTDGTYVPVGEGSARLGSRSYYVFEWDVDDPAVGGSYRALARLPKHDDHAGGFSPVVSFVIDPQP